MNELKKDNFCQFLTIKHYSMHLKIFGKWSFPRRIRHRHAKRLTLIHIETFTVAASSFPSHLMQNIWPLNLLSLQLLTEIYLEVPSFREII